MPGPGGHGGHGGGPGGRGGMGGPGGHGRAGGREVTEEWEDLVVIITADTCRLHRQEDMGTEDITDRIMAADV